MPWKANALRERKRSIHRMVHRKKERWINHYSSRQKILLVGEGNFSFSVCLARAFASASNMIATSLDARKVVISKYSKGADNLMELTQFGCSIMYKLDVHTMSQNPSLKTIKFDRIVYNFPHAGFQYPGEHYRGQIKLHRDVLRGFFRSAREMLSRNGEAHVTHKTSHPFSEWRIEELAEECGLYLVDEVEFSKFDYPGYQNKKGHGPNSDRSFPVGSCSTFKFKKGHGPNSDRSFPVGSCSTFKFALLSLPRYDSAQYCPRHFYPEECYEAMSNCRFTLLPL